MIIDRRRVLSKGLASAAVIATAQSFSNLALAAKGSPAPGSREDVIKATSHCIQTSLACLAHCQDAFQAGNKEMAACSAGVQDTLATCEALLKLASLNSPLAKTQAKVCADACAQCAKNCEKHSNMAACQACREACLACEKACRAFTAA